MILKPKMTVGNPKALIYRRFIGIEKSLNLNALYLTSDGKYWTFDSQTETFTEFELAVPTTTRIVSIPNVNTIVQYKDEYFRYTTLDGWGTVQLGQQNVLSASFNDIAKYQMNKYYFVGSFDFMIKGSIEGSVGQYIKGNIVPLNSFNIKFYDDVDLSPDDLVVIDNKLFAVENVETSYKQQPKAYKIYFATLNNIL